MSDRAARTSWHRQYRRTIRLLIESDGFVAAGPHRTHAYEQGYTLRASPADAPSSAGLDAIVARLAEGPEGQPWQLRLLGPETMAATTLDRDELERFLRAALETARGWLTAGQMSEILARRFCLDRSPPPALAERSDPVLAPGDPTGELILAEVIDAVRAELRANDVALLRRWRKAVDTNKPPPGSSAQRADLAARIRGVAAQQQASPTDMATALEHVLDQLDEALVVA